VVRHEAGHFLTAYLLGCPIESCVLSAWQASSDPRFIGAAGTLFFDPELTRGAAQVGGVDDNIKKEEQEKEVETDFRVYSMRDGESFFFPTV
jgi:hypothetical protein